MSTCMPCSFRLLPTPGPRQRAGMWGTPGRPGAVPAGRWRLSARARARTGTHRPGGRTPVTTLGSHKLVSGHTSPSGRMHLHAALPDRPTAPGMTPRSGRFRVRPVRQDQTHHRGPPPSSLAVHRLEVANGPSSTVNAGRRDRPASNAATNLATPVPEGQATPSSGRRGP
jgi:hypothetical protein